jgi:aminoglycoside/choline kinase family phosphotransferase
LDKRLNTLKKWLVEDLKLPVLSINVASADASFRRYFRVEIDPELNRKLLKNSLSNALPITLPNTIIAMDSPPEHEDNVLFVNCTEFLNDCGLNIPNIYAKNIELGFLLIKDLGVRTFDKALDIDTADDLYADATLALLKMQTTALQHTKFHQTLPYDDQKLQLEMSLFEDWYIKEHHNSALNSNQQNALDRTFKLLISSALEQPQVLVHRDYHCRNLLVNEKQNPGIIDYQDMVIGPITYDLVSLLKDCYIEWPTEKVDLWALQFHKLILKNSLHSEISTTQWLRWFDWMGVQRHLKILGIFCRLYYRDGKDQYLGDLDLTYRYLMNTCQKYPELKSLKEILEQYPVQK